MVSIIANILATINQIKKLIVLLTAELDVNPNATIEFGGRIYYISQLIYLLQQCENELNYALGQERNELQKKDSITNIWEIRNEFNDLIKSLKKELCVNLGATIKIGNHNLKLIKFKCLLRQCKKPLRYAQAQAWEKSKISKISNKRKKSTKSTKSRKR